MKSSTYRVLKVKGHGTEKCLEDNVETLLCPKNSGKFTDNEEKDFIISGSLDAFITHKHS